MLIHERIRAYRKSHGITQTHVAKALNIPVQRFNAIEVGRVKLTADFFEAICQNGLGVDPVIFFTDDVLKNKTKSA